MLSLTKVIDKILFTIILSALTLSIIVLNSSISSAGFYPNKIGFDVSYPQCSKVLPDDPLFAVIGVNGGKAYKPNPCLASLFKWAQSGKLPPSLYVNLNFISPLTIHHSIIGPKICNPIDQECLAYNYGYQAIEYSFNYAKNSHAITKNWWLDIETMNTWSNDVVLNRNVIAGAIDNLRSKDLIVGVYSTRYQWTQITGDWDNNLPVWLAGARDKEQAYQRCDESRSFTGGKVIMVQYIENDLDHNFLCN
ncbi:MAG: hypothetical protein M3P33_03655 [bacterium]|nr:hypothetical protein [bacterium]